MSDIPAVEQQITHVSIDLIDDPAKAIRTSMDEQGIEDLAADIRRNGLIEPIILVRRAVHTKPDECTDIKITPSRIYCGHTRYEIVAGHRRFTAFKRTGEIKIPAIVRVLNEQEILQVKISENLYRQNVDLLDECAFYAQLVVENEMTAAQIAETIGRSEPYVQMRLDVVSYPESFHEALAEKKITLGAARALATVDDDHERETLLQYAIRDGVTVARAEEWAAYYHRMKAIGTPPVFSEMTPQLVTELAQPKIVCERCNEGAILIELRQAWVHRAQCPKFTGGGEQNE